MPSNSPVSSQRTRSLRRGSHRLLSTGYLTFHSYLGTRQGMLIWRALVLCCRRNAYCYWETRLSALSDPLVEGRFPTIAWPCYCTNIWSGLPCSMRPSRASSTPISCLGAMQVPICSMPVSAAGCWHGRVPALCTLFLSTATALGSFISLIECLRSALVFPCCVVPFSNLCHSLLKIYTYNLFHSFSLPNSAKSSYLSPYI